MKKQLSLAMAGVMALSLAACGGSSASSAGGCFLRCREHRREHCC